RVILQRVPASTSHDRVVRVRGRVGSDQRAEVDTRLLQIKLQLATLATPLQGLQVGDGVDRVATSGGTDVAGHLVDLTGRGGDEAVAVGVDGVAVDPVLLVAFQGVGVQLTGGDDEVPHLAVDVGAVYGELIGEAVEVTQLLLLGERRVQDLRVQDTAVGESDVVLGVGALRLLSTLPVAPVALVGDVVVLVAVGVAGGVEVAGYVLALFLRAVRGDGELLQNWRPGHAGEEGGQ